MNNTFSELQYDIKYLDDIKYLGNEIQRFYSYRLQFFYALKSHPQSILIIGKGDGIIENALMNWGLKVKSLDISKDLNPDVVASVSDIPFKNNSFDVVICCEVLEHLPFDYFYTSLMELKRITNGF